MNIHPTAIVDSGAVLDSTVAVGPYSIIEKDVVIGPHCKIESYAQIKNGVTMGSHNHVFSYSSLGQLFQDIKHHNSKPGRLVIGSHNIFREGSLFSVSTTKNPTKIGSHNYFMLNAHIGHDCTVGDHNIIGNTAGLGGHVTIGNHVGISPQVLIHQFCRIGDYAFLGKSGIVVQDIAPYMLIVKGYIVAGINSNGLKRHNFSSKKILTIKRVYKTFYRSGLSAKDALTKIKELASDSPKDVQNFIDFVAEPSQRGIARTIPSQAKAI